MAAVVATTVSACSLLIDFDAYRDAGGEGAMQMDSDLADSFGSSDATYPISDGACEGSLTDFNNCGQCGRVCNEGAGTCEAGRCRSTPLFDDDASIAAVAVARYPAAGSEELYFTTGQAFVAGRAVPDGSIEMTATPGPAARAVAVNPTGTQGVVVVAAQTIDTFDAGSFGGPLGHVLDSTSNIESLWLSDSTVFWGNVDGGTWWAPTTADAPWGGGPDASAGIAVSFAQQYNTVVWVTANGAVFSVNAAAPTTVQRILPSSAPFFTSIALSDTYLYLCQKSALAGAVLIYSVSNLATVLNTVRMSNPVTVVTDGQSVYVMNFNPANDATLWRMKADGTEPIILADHLRMSRALAVDGRWVYFADGPTLLRTTK